MSNWKYILDIKDTWQDEGIPIKDKGKVIASLIKHTFPESWLDWDSDEYDEDLDNIVEAFDNITGYDDVSPVEEFNEWMAALYDYGNQEVAPFRQWPANKMAWIKTA